MDKGPNSDLDLIWALKIAGLYKRLYEGPRSYFESGGGWLVTQSERAENTFSQ